MSDQEQPPNKLYRLEYLRDWHGQPTPIHCVKWFKTLAGAESHRDNVANGRGTVISLAEYVVVDKAYELPDPEEDA